ncbi:MAG: penicillin-binding protein 2, partial [Trueperaceae bacterium]
GVFPVEVAGKTGTAQTARGNDYTHAWFMGYAPMNDPEIGIALFVEHGGSSSRVAVPLARDFMTGYYGVPPVQAQR